MNWPLFFWCFNMVLYPILIYINLNFTLIHITGQSIFWHIKLAFRIIAMFFGWAASGGTVHFWIDFYYKGEPKRIYIP